METASEGGPYGMALLVAYMMERAESEKLEDYLANKVFADVEQNTIFPQAEDVAGFENFVKKYKAYLAVERAATRIK
jgi:sugar (pentulose or hexulose) kinase